MIECSWAANIAAVNTFPKFLAGVIVSVKRPYKVLGCEALVRFGTKFGISTITIAVFWIKFYWFNETKLLDLLVRGDGLLNHLLVDD